MSKFLKFFERSLANLNTSKALTKSIIDADPGLRSSGIKKGAIRLQPASSSYNIDTFRKTLDALDINVDSHEISPGEPHSGSGKFPTFKVTKDGKDFYIVLGGGSFGNKGMSFERQILDELKNAIDTGEHNHLIDELKKISGKEFIGVETGFNRLVKRKLSDKPEDVGAKISDVTLIDEDGNRHYISLKDKGGKTISNNGINGIFTIKDSKVLPGKHDAITELIKAAKVDINLAAKGLNAYKDEKIGGLSDIKDVTASLSIDDTDTIRNFIASGIDYGYLYVKNKGNNNYEIVNLVTPEDVYNFIGDITEVKLSYPFYSSTRKRKHVSIMVKTTRGGFSFDIRNTSGELIPKQINLVRTSITPTT